jgi:UDP-N-acetylglucosamine--N-acetylmuramyl-(pentapeptide) pyrophosphoryl-undecaprenol N-acetylglucosamine transferase
MVKGEAVNFKKQGSARALRLCLAGSGGGHLRQLLDLESVWAAHDHYFVTEHSAIADDLAPNHRVHIVEHFAAGQARLGRPMAMLWGAFVNMIQSLKIALRERPDLVISTGAGAMFWTALFSRALGAKFILIESFARFDAPSKFARSARRFASQSIVQSDGLRAQWPGALLFDPLKRLDQPLPPKKPLLLATVGATLPFDRMSAAVVALKERGVISHDVVIQVGENSAVEPREDRVNGVRIVKALPFAEIQMLLKDAEIVICHGGTGSFITALRQGCRVIAMPRLSGRGEHYDDHQFEISSAFAARGLIEVALEADDLPAAIARAGAKMPVVATTDPSALIAWLNDYLAQLGGQS